MEYKEIRRAIILTILLCAGLNAAELKKISKHTKMEWTIHLATIGVDIAGTLLDMKSSFTCNHVVGVGGARCTEGDPLFSSGPDRGFHTRGVVLGGGITAALVGTQIWRFSKPASKSWEYIAVGNGGWGALHFVAWHQNNILQREILGWRPAATAMGVAQ